MDQTLFLTTRDSAKLRGLTTTKKPWPFTTTGSHIETLQPANYISQKMVNDKSIVLYNYTKDSPTSFLRERPHPNSEVHPSLTGVELVI